MGLKTGDIYRLVHRMVDEGVLDADQDPPVRGTQFSLSEFYRERLEETPAAAGDAGTLAAGQRVLIVTRPERAALYDVLSQPRAAGHIAWVAELEGPSRLLIALDHEASMIQADRLAVALERAGLRARFGVIGEIVPGEVLRRAADTMNAGEPVR